MLLVLPVPIYIRLQLSAVIMSSPFIVMTLLLVPAWKLLINKLFWVSLREYLNSYVPRWKRLIVYIQEANEK